MKVLRIWHRLINFHVWESDTSKEYDGWDYSEPHERHGGYLPTQWKSYHCECGATKRVYFDGFTHLGVSDPREFVKE